MTMRGEDSDQGSVSSYVPLVARIPKDHPLRPMRAMVDTALPASAFERALHGRRHADRGLGQPEELPAQGR